MKSPLTYSPLIQDKGGAKQELSNTVFAPKQGFLYAYTGYLSHIMLLNCCCTFH
jgi:hypothetical protein